MYISYSKINLHLKITGKRPDGYHELESIFLPLASPADQLMITTSASGIEISCNTKNVPTNSQNICHKAVTTYAKFALERKKQVISSDIKIHIEKTIPVAAGLGGGSSNAAVVLNHLNQENKLFTTNELIEIAKTIGADVPFFLKPEPALVKVLVKKITPVSLPVQELPLLIIAPGFPVSAKWCYQNLKPGRDIVPGKLADITRAFKEQNWEELGNLIENDLAQPVFAKFPIMSLICDEIKKHDVNSILMSGSGPTLFAICRDKSHARSLTQKLPKSFPDKFRFIAV